MNSFSKILHSSTSSQPTHQGDAAHQHMDQTLTQLLYLGRAHSAPGNTESATVICTTKIQRIAKMEQCFYHTCTKCLCQKGVEPVHTMFWCNACEDFCQDPTIKLKFEMEVTDNTSVVLLKIQDEEAEKLIGKSAYMLCKETMIGAAPQEIKELLGAQITFEVKSHTYFDTGDYESFCCTDIIHDPSQTLVGVVAFTTAPLKMQFPDLEILESPPRDYSDSDEEADHIVDAMLNPVKGRKKLVICHQMMSNTGEGISLATKLCLSFQLHYKDYAISVL